MRTVIFAGPTITAREVRSVLPDVEVRGPIACGDILRLKPTAAFTIGIIDGVFEHSLPVWHKEILWALSRGCRVYGASSMGALRAAELAAFGMVGVGRIFEWYRDGVLEDDDEVAIAHDVTSTYRPRSDAMVNVRATLARAVRAGATDDASAGQLLAAVKATVYPQRDLRRTLAAADLPAAVRARLADWIETAGLFDQKAADARELLQRIADDGGSERAAAKDFDFSYTEVFAELVRSLEAAPRPPASGAATDTGPDDDLLEELQLRGAEIYRGCWLAALERALAGALAQPPGAAAVREQVLRALKPVLHERGLLEPLAARAARKSHLLASADQPEVRAATSELLAWHFSSFGRAIPDDIQAYARSVGLPDTDALILMLARERWYVDRSGEAVALELHDVALLPNGDRRA